MDKKIAGMLGAVAAVAAVSGAQASAPVQTSNDPLAVQSYADLLAPIPNAAQLLIADDAKLTAQSAGGVQVAQVVVGHHHHHHVVVAPRRRYWRHHHHHHHHHHHGAFVGVPGVGGVVVH